MVYLHPHFRAVGATDLSPTAEPLQASLILKHHASRSGHRAPIHHDIARQDQTCPAVRPCLVQPQQRVGWRVACVGHVFFHGGFGNPIGEFRAVWQLKRREERHEAMSAHAREAKVKGC